MTVQCGRCKDAYTPDEEWVDRYYTSKRAPHENGKAYSPKHRRRLNDEENREALAALAEERDRLLDLIR